MNSSSWDQIATAAYLSIPLMVSGVLHMVAVKANFLPSLAKPLSVSLFGENKTFRGLLLIPITSLMGVWLTISLADSSPLVRMQDVNPWLLGLSLGIGYAVFELPNSWIKRRLGIPPGQRAENHAFLFALLDQGDSVVGCVLVYALFFPLGWETLVICIVLGTGIHLLFNLALFAAKLRAEPI